MEMFFKSSERDFMDMSFDNNNNNNNSCNNNPNWLIDYDLMDGFSSVSAAAGAGAGAFHHHTPLHQPLPMVVQAVPATPASVTIDFSWASQSINCSSNVCEEIDCSFDDSEGFKEIGSRKRVKAESYNASGTKACREKSRRDKLNERFMELSSVLEPERPPKMEKTALLSDAVRMITQLRTDAEKLKESNEELLEKIKDLKAEKNELRDEKQKLKADKEKLEQQVKSFPSQPGFLPQASLMGPGFAAKAQNAGNKLMPFIGYPGVAMWQFMQPAIVDTSQDHVLRPPVA